MNIDPGVNEIEWLADLKGVAERVGKEVLGFDVRWRVESRLSARKKRPDVVVETDAGQPLFSGEAKRPDTPEGVHPLVAKEVDGAVFKAQSLGVPFCFTTNFHDIALLDAGSGPMQEPLRRLQGSVIPFVLRSRATSIGWWIALSGSEREAAAESGLRSLFLSYGLLMGGQILQAPIDDIALGFFADLTNALLTPLHRQMVTTKTSMPADINHQALIAGLDPMDDQQSRYLVAQGIAEVLSAALFHRLLRDHFSSLHALLAGTTPKTGKALVRVITDSMAEAKLTSGDYEPILALSGIATWVLASASPDVVRNWLSLAAFIDGLDPSSLSADVLGTIFERLNSPERRHAMGQHYTQPRLARAMSRWGITEPDLIALDPACGAGTFLTAVYAELASHGVSHDAILRNVFGNDLDAFAVHLASINLVTRRLVHGLNYPLVRLGDAFDLAPGVEMLSDQAASRGQNAPLPKADLVITNPPYARANADELRSLKRLRALFGALIPLPDTHGINQAAWFVLLGAALAKPGARMAFVLPSAVLQNDNLISWRKWVRDRYDLVVWHTEHDIWFSDARIAPCVILFTPRTSGVAQTGRVDFVKVQRRTDGTLTVTNGVPVPAMPSELRDLSGVPSDADLLIAGTKPTILERFEGQKTVRRLDALSGMELNAGQKLGHAFFRLTDEDPSSPAMLRSVTGLGTTMRVSRQYLSPILAGPKELTSGEPSLTRHWLLTLGDKRPKNETLKRYIDLGRSQDVHLAPSVSGRGESWWSIKAQLWDVAIPMSAQFRHQVAWLEPRSAATNNFNVLRTGDRLDAELVAASIASAFGALMRLYVSGEIGCEGARRILLSQFKDWSVLDPKATDPLLRDRCLDAYRAWRSYEGSELDLMPAEELRVWRQLTISVAQAAMGTASPNSAAVAMADEAIREAQNTVARRRQREAEALQGRTRQPRAAGGRLASRVRVWAKVSTAYAEVLASLTGGSALYRLRSVKEIDQLSIFAAQGPFAAQPEIEKALAGLFGAGFEAAWPSESNEADKHAALSILAENMLQEGVQVVLGEPPDASSPARPTWDRLGQVVRAEIRRQLQSDVRNAFV